MSQLLKRIRYDQLTARKEKDTVRAKLLTTLIGEASPAGNAKVTDEDVKKVIRKFIKNAHFTMQNANTDIAVSVAAFEFGVLSGYLPAPMTNVHYGLVYADLPIADKGVFMKKCKEYAQREGLEFNGKDANVFFMTHAK